MNINTVAVVILYNPNLKKLQYLFESIYFQINAIVFVDNSPTPQAQTDNQNWLKNLNQSNCHYVSLGDNLGIATAQNKGIEYAKNNGFDFVLLLDQDSVLPNNMVQNLFLSYQVLTHTEKKIAVVAPCFIDEKTQQYSKIFKRSRYLPKKIIPTGEKVIEVDYAIASGSLIHLDVFSQVGGLNDSLFIDWVDIEWCYRARQYGFKSYVIPQAIMQHSLGDEIIQDLNISLHSDFRNYFIVRNSLYLALYSKLPMNFRIIQLFKTPLYVLFYSYHSKKPFYSLKLLLIAIKDAIFKKMGKGYFSEKEI